MASLFNPMLDALAQPRIDSPKPDLTSQARCHSIRWACVYTRPQAERWADQGLRRQGYTTFLPLLTVTRRDRVTPTMTHRVEVPAFPRYLFVQFDASLASWSPIRATPGVLDLVRNGIQLQYASSGDLQRVRTALEAQPHPDATWRPGAACSIAVGPGNAMPAVVTAVHGNTATVSLMMLGHLRNMAVPLASLRARDE